MLLLKDIEHYFINELNEYLKEEDTDVSDIIYEVAEHNIPVYYTELLHLASMNLWLAIEEPDIPVNNAMQVIHYNLNQHLIEL